MALNVDAIKELARKAYKKEYDRDTPPGRTAEVFGVGGGLMMVGSIFAGFAGIVATLINPVTGPLVIIGAVGGFFLGATSMLFAAVVANDAANKALERDLDNGTLVKRFQDEVLAPSASSPGAGAIAAFRAAQGEAPAANATSAAPLPAPKPPVAGL